MFLDYYGLREDPFGVTPDPRFLYMSLSHREALAGLYYGIETGRGFLALIAKPGMGKTTLLFHLQEKLRSSARTAFLFQTQCGSREFLRSLLTDLGVNRPEDDIVGMQKQLNEMLICESSAGRRFVLMIDEAQNLQDSVLETLRMLSNFETRRKKLVQILMAGQSQLANKLASPQLVQLRQRVSILSRLNHFTAPETADYIRHRLTVAGYNGRPLFGPEALKIIASASQGIPRNINNLCFHALTLGFGKGEKVIGAAILEEVAADLNMESLGSDLAIKEKTFSGSLPELGVSSPRVELNLSPPPEIPSVAPERKTVSKTPVPRVCGLRTAAVATPVKLWRYSNSRKQRSPGIVGAVLGSVGSVVGIAWLVSQGIIFATSRPRAPMPAVVRPVQMASTTVAPRSPAGVGTGLEVEKVPASGGDPRQPSVLNEGKMRVPGRELSPEQQVELRDRLVVARFYADRGYYAEALASFKAALKLNPSNREAQRGIARARQSLDTERNTIQP